MDVPASLRLTHFCQIRDLFVLPTHRRLGVGRALLASVRAAAIASSALRLVVQTEDDNDPALRLYSDSGLVPAELDATASAAATAARARKICKRRAIRQAGTSTTCWIMPPSMT